MKMSDGEKLIALMLCDIYDKFEIKGETGIKPSLIKRAIQSEKTWVINEAYKISSSSRPEEAEEVSQIMDMWSNIEASYEELNKKDQNEVKELAREPKFDGFDGNNESEYKSIAEYFINDLDLFCEFKNRELNSHGARLKSYKDMLSVYNNSLGYMKDHFGKLPTDILISLLNEMKSKEEVS